MGMQYEQTKYVGDVQILKRKPFEAVPMTLNFSSVETKLANGKKVVKANTATVVGILLHDVTEDRPQGTLLKKAYIDTAVAQAHSGVEIASAVKTALPMIVFE